jgi:transcriptional regulator with XRE-family HTH domain
MLSARIGVLLKGARRYLNLSRADLAERGGVSVRLVAEFERGQRPNVSLESALKLLNVVGVTVIATAPDGAAAEIRGEAAETLARAARAAQRRQTWTGRRIHLHDEGNDPRPERSKANRLASVARVSKQVYLFASAPQHKTVQAKGTPGR